MTILDVAGVGGTSWARVEAERGDERLRRVAAPFFDWGIPTAEAVGAMAPLMQEIVGAPTGKTPVSLLGRLFGRHGA